MESRDCYLWRQRNRLLHELSQFRFQSPDQVTLSVIVDQISFFLGISRQVVQLVEHLMLSPSNPLVAVRSDRLVIAGQKPWKRLVITEVLHQYGGARWLARPGCPQQRQIRSALNMPADLGSCELK